MSGFTRVSFPHNMNKNETINGGVEDEQLYKTTTKKTQEQAADQSNVASAADSQQNADEATATQEKVLSFDDMNLDDALLRGIYGKGFEKPSLVQQVAIMPLTRGRDAVVQAQSGTGKTGAFAIGTLARVECDKQAPQVLVLEPVRELAKQTAEVYRDLSLRMGIQVALVTGGTAMQKNRQQLRTAQVIVGTPGRLLDVMRRDWFHIESIRMFVIDEADEMLDRGFIDDLRALVSQLSKDCQVAVFSATFKPEDLELTQRFTNNPLRILVKAEELTLAGIYQHYVAVGRDEYKMETLADLYGELSVGQSIVFCRTQRRVEELCDYLHRHEFTPAGIHGNLSHEERQAILEKFRRGEARVLVTTDLCARGIDVVGIGCAINFDLPRDKATYLHRVGRVGRYGRKGVAISLVADRDVGLLRDIEHFYDTQIEELPADFSQRLK